MKAMCLRVLCFLQGGALILLLFLYSLSITAAGQTIFLQLDGGAFKVVGLPAAALREPAAGWASVFAIYVGTGAVPALAGSYSIENGALVFRPKYPLAPGPRYRAVFRGAGASPIEQTFEGPAHTVTPAARVDRVYPSSGVLPSNQLRLYIYFSAPMSRGEAEQRIHVLDADGKPLRGVFLPGQELW
ncbi:MAG TPA: Ig-like domain-containing protein, partial [Vicinamibacterales bacterium]|nr:Ig-like domain-containing protein [Vicinamibacterales bacterium]